MRPARFVLLLVFAAFLAAEPVIHTHPLVPLPWGGDTNGITTPNVCAVCVFGTARIPQSAPALIPPDHVVERLASIYVDATSADPIRPSSSRAPPAA